MTETLPNNLRTHRKNSGLTQRDVARAVGYRHAGAVLRHETFRSTPPLDVAFGYEIIFRVPVARIFVGLRKEVEKQIEARLSEMETTWGMRSAKERSAKAIAQRLAYLWERRNTDPEPEPFS